jgi:hypothetical protein
MVTGPISQRLKPPQELIGGARPTVRFMVPEHGLSFEAASQERVKGLLFSTYGFVATMD